MFSSSRLQLCLSHAPSPASHSHDNFVVPYWSHALQLWLATSLPRWAQGSYMFGMHNGLRKRALRKAAKLKEKTH